MLSQEEKCRSVAKNLEQLIDEVIMAGRTLKLINLNGTSLLSDHSCFLRRLVLSYILHTAHSRANPGVV